MNKGRTNQPNCRKDRQLTGAQKQPEPGPQMQLALFLFLSALLLSEYWLHFLSLQTCSCMSYERWLLGVSEFHISQYWRETITFSGKILGKGSGTAGARCLARGKSAKVKEQDMYFYSPVFSGEN